MRVLGHRGGHLGFLGNISPRVSREFSAAGFSKHFPAEGFYISPPPPPDRNFATLSGEPRGEPRLIPTTLSGEPRLIFLFQ